MRDRSSRTSLQGALQQASARRAKHRLEKTRHVVSALVNRVRCSVNSLSLVDSESPQGLRSSAGSVES
jgi:hypothetical protein